MSKNQVSDRATQNDLCSSTREKYSYRRGFSSGTINTNTRYNNENSEKNNNLEIGNKDKILTKYTSPYQSIKNY